MLPSAVGVVVRYWGAALASLGTRLGRPAALVAGRWAQARPGVVVRLVAVVVIGIGVITQAQVWSGRLSDSGQNAQAMQRLLRDSVLVVTPRPMTEAGLAGFLADLPSGAQLLTVTGAKQPGEVSVLSGSCAAIRSLGIACPPASSRLTADGDVRAAMLRHYFGAIGDVEIREGSVLSGARTAEHIVVLSPVGSHSRSTPVKEAAYRAFGVVHVQRPYDDWVLGADRLVTMAKWVRLLTILTLTVLFLAVAFGSAAEFLVFTTAAAPLAGLSERRRFLFGIAFWNLTVPTVIAAAFGACVAAWQGSFFIAMTRSGEFSRGLLAATAAGVLVLAIGVGLAAGVAAIRAATRWRPVAD